jgi:hypothetical protein
VGGVKAEVQAAATTIAARMGGARCAVANIAEASSLSKNPDSEAPAPQKFASRDDANRSVPACMSKWRVVGHALRQNVISLNKVPSYDI